MDPQLRALATSLLDDDKQKRRKNVRRLKAFVSTNSELFHNADYFKLWEALFFALWSADTPALQREVCCNFCQLIRYVPNERMESWNDAFWFVLQREWDKLDRYRIDKFQLFMRMFIAESFHWVKQQGWSDDSITKVTSSWSLVALKPPASGESHSFGVGYHLVEVMMEELNQERKNDANFTNETLIKIIKPFLDALSYSNDNILAAKVQEHILLSLDPSIEGEIETVGEWLFEKAARMKFESDKDKKRKIKLPRLYQAIQGIDLALSSVGRQANYAMILNRLKDEFPVNSGDDKGLSIEEMTEQSKVAQKMGKKTPKKIKTKARKGKFVTMIFKTRRKRIIKRRRISQV